MNSVLAPGSVWECKKTTVIDRKTVVKGTWVTITQLSITVNECIVVFNVNGFATFVPSGLFRNQFIKVKEAHDNE